MIQEIITYMIIGSAVTIAVMKTLKKFRKKRKNKNLDFKKETFSMEHNCSDCSAECILRDSAKPSSIIKENKLLCKKTDVELNQF